MHTLNRRGYLTHSLLLIALIVSGCQGGGGGAGQPAPPTALTPGQTASGTLGGGGQRFRAILDAKVGVTYGVSLAVDSSSFIPSSQAVELLVTGQPLPERLSIRNDFSRFQTPGLSLTPTDFFTAQSSGPVTFELVNATVSDVPAVFGFFGATDTSIRYDLLVEEVDERNVAAGSSGFPSRLFPLDALGGGQ